MPGVLQVEAMAQVASILLFKNTGVSGKLGYFMSADKVKWRKPVLPGDTLIIEVELTKSRGKIAKAMGVCRVKNEIVSEAELMFGHHRCLSRSFAQRTAEATEEGRRGEGVARSQILARGKANPNPQVSPPKFPSAVLFSYLFGPLCETSPAFNLVIWQI